MNRDDNFMTKALDNAKLIEPGKVVHLKGQDFVVLREQQGLLFVTPSISENTDPFPPWPVQAMPTQMVPGWQS